MKMGSLSAAVLIIGLMSMLMGEMNARKFASE